MSKRNFGLVFIIFLCFGIISAVVSAPTTSRVTAVASEQEINGLVVRQTTEVFYLAENYVNNNGEFVNLATDTDFFNPLFESLEFSIDGSPITVTHDMVTCNNTNMTLPRDYEVIYSVNYKDNFYSAKCRTTVKKKLIEVRVKLNGKTNLTIDEGENYTATIEYEGFVGMDTVNSLAVPAYINSLPKFPIIDCEIIANGASSDKYYFLYKPAYVTITGAPINYITDTSGTFTIDGEISPLYELQMLKVNISKTNEIFVGINSKLESAYKNTGLLNKYEPKACYNVRFLVDGNEIDAIGKYSIKIKIPTKLASTKELKLVVFGTNGKSDVYNVVADADGNIACNTMALGDFIVLAPIEGLNETAIYGVIFGGVVAVVLAIILFSVFRKKF